MSPAAEGIVTRPSQHPVGQTLDRLEELLRAHGVTIFARVDHGAGAVGVGLTMPPSELLIFGHPRGGTPIMRAAPLAAIDLPFKALAWQDEAGATWLSYNEPRYLAERFGLTDVDVAPLAPLVALIEQAAR
ncbi:MAG TPA: DUF302 domain-containing protein [Polyangia bacterium]|jgi:uncharacterized protein (DUF302 family)|nr:DUF302 domain-containing protein [Polyangia bacterium]